MVDDAADLDEDVGNLDKRNRKDGVKQEVSSRVRRRLRVEKENGSTNLGGSPLI